MYGTNRDGIHLFPDANLATLEQPKFMNEFLPMFVSRIAQYLVVAGLAFLIFWIIAKRPLARRRIQLKQRSKPKNWWHDIGWSVLSQAVFVGFAIAVSPLTTFSLVRIPNTAAGVVLSLVVVLFLDDTWFYWTHRALHTPKLYKRLHRIHHNSADPSPFTSFAFHPVEAFTITAGGLFISLLLGAPTATISLFGIVSALNNISAHLGYEWAPRIWHKIPVLGWKTPSTHHNLHHEKVRGNYALYFVFWDRWMGTEFGDYSQRFESIARRVKEPVLD
jgi:sterol desaturase/sphingolipid hydroxylase (fatty acid hydroxylase superfamily)